MKSVATLMSLSLAACYGAAPGRPPKVPLPSMAEGAEIDVHSETKTTMESVSKQASSCPAGHGEGDPACTITRYSVVEPVTRTTTTASYGAEPITFAQFKVITDPKYNDKLALLDDLAHKCQRANKPRYAGMALMLGGLVAGVAVSSADKTAGGAILYGGVGAGMASYALGYFAFGGRDCNEADKLYHELDLSQAMDWNSVEGTEYATEMKALAHQFNASLRQRSAQLRMR